MTCNDNHDSDGDVLNSSPSFGMTPKKAQIIHGESCFAQMVFGFIKFKLPKCDTFERIKKLGDLERGNTPKFKRHASMLHQKGSSPKSLLQTQKST